MRIDEFKQALGAIADDVGEVDQVEFVGEVDRKVGHARRARAATAGGGLGETLAHMLIYERID